MRTPVYCKNFKIKQPMSFSQLRTQIQLNPNDASIPEAIKSLKLQVFRNLAQNPKSEDAQRDVRSFCEVDVLYSLTRHNLADYELAAHRLNSIYQTSLKTLGYSEDYYNLQGVYLLYLLSFNKLGQFYSEIELLPLNALDHPSISQVISIEQELSIGNYGAVLQLNKQESLGQMFLARIIETIRDQTAMSASTAYQRLKLDDALQLFHLNQVSLLKDYAAGHNYNWQFDEDYVYLDQRNQNANPLNSEALINNNLHYVHELDKII